MNRNYNVRTSANAKSAQNACLMSTTVANSTVNTLPNNTR
jgi:hypothetical protein